MEKGARAPRSGATSRGLYAPRSGRRKPVSRRPPGAPPARPVRWRRGERRRCRSSSSGVLLLARGAGGLARPPAAAAGDRRLPRGRRCSCRRSRPGYVADRDQLQLLADVGVGAAAVRGRHRGRPRASCGASTASSCGPRRSRRSSPPRSRRPPRRSPASRRSGRARSGLGVAMSSSVVIVNITRSRRRTTTPETERGAARLERPPGHHRRRARGRPARGLRRRGAPAARRVRRPARRSPRSRSSSALVLPRVLRRLRREHDLFLIVSVASGPRAGRGGRRRRRRSRSRWPRSSPGSAITESPESAEARRRLLPFRDVFAVLFFVAIGTLIDPDAFGRGLGWLALIVALVVVAKVARRVAPGPRRAAPRRAGPARRSVWARSASSASCSARRRPRPARSGRRSTPRSSARSS